MFQKCATSQGRSKLFTPPSAPFHYVFFGWASFSESFFVHYWTAFEPINVITTFHTSKPSQSTIPGHQTDWIKPHQFSELCTVSSFKVNPHIHIHFRSV